MNISLSTHFVAKVKNGFNDLHHSDDTLTRIITHDGETYYYDLPKISKSEFRSSILAAFETEPSHIQKYGDNSWKAFV